MRLLIIEDEPELVANILLYLKSKDYVCDVAVNFEEALEKIEIYTYDCILLDLMLPGGTGLQILNQLKIKNNGSGVLIMSAKNSLEDKIKGLEEGADDYLAKPFHLSELAARILAIVRRKQFKSNNSITSGLIIVDLLSKTAKINTVELKLTRKEYDLLLLFLSNENKVISKEAIAENLSGDIADMLDNHDFIYAHIKNLKRKISVLGCESYIQTLYGSGYKWHIYE